VAWAALLSAIVWTASAWASPPGPGGSTKLPFSRVLVIVFENADPSEALAVPAFADLARTSALLTNYHAVAHPSQPNYIALIAGSTLGVQTNAVVSLPGQHIGNLLEKHGKTWRVYAENYPGHCFLGPIAGLYTSKHVPFLSFRNVRKNPARCANIVDASEFDKDLAANRLPDYSLYIPNNLNDGHRTSIRVAGEWFAKRFGSLIAANRLPNDLLLVLTCDEDEGRPGEDNRVIAILHGAMVAPGRRSDQSYTHYSLLRTIEEGLGLGTLGRQDASAPVIQDIWTTRVSQR
jgi:hypothetical protein